MSDVASLPPRLILFDGVCGMCDQFVQVMLDLDQAGAFHYAPLQGDTATSLRQRHPEIPPTVDTIVYVEDGEVYLFSNALLKAAVHLPAPWRWGRHLLWVPRPLRDLVYKGIAANRYRIWGKLESCRIPTEDQVGRFLD